MTENDDGDDDGSSGGAGSGGLLRNLSFRAPRGARREPAGQQAEVASHKALVMVPDGDYLVDDTFEGRTIYRRMRSGRTSYVVKDSRMVVLGEFETIGEAQQFLEPDAPSLPTP